MSGRRRFDVGSWGTFGQIALLILATLLASQVVTFLLLRNVEEKWQNAAVVQPAVERFAETAQQAAHAQGAAREQLLALAEGRDQHFRLAAEAGGPRWPNDEAVADNLAAALKKRNVEFKGVRALMLRPFSRPPLMPRGEAGGSRPPFDDEFNGPPGRPANVPPDAMPGGMPPSAGPGGDRPGPGQPDRPGGFAGFVRWPFGPGPGEVGLAVQFADGTWLSGRFVMHSPRPWFLDPLVASESVLFLALLGLSLFWASRISQPLRLLARAAESLRPQDDFQPIPERGPRDVRAAVVSFNAMAGRVKALVQEKDRMLSAIGHDLRTPLASLRLRAETIEPASERERVIETIGEMTKMIDDILSLARLGRSTETRLTVDLAALADSLVEEYRELGKDVTFEEAPRTPLVMQQTLVRRLLRNLIDNAIKYGERARVTLAETAEAVTLCVEDDGPGIPAEALEEVRQPFTRLEQSRSKQTGGIGLGLTIADAIARGQGAELLLENIASGGLRASVRWPKQAAAAAPDA